MDKKEQYSTQDILDKIIIKNDLNRKRMDEMEKQYQTNRRRFFIAFVMLIIMFVLVPLIEFLTNFIFNY